MLSQRVEQKQQFQKMRHDSHKPYREFTVGDAVYIEDFTPSRQKWIKGIITDVTGPLSYKVTLKLMVLRFVVMWTVLNREATL